MKKKNNCPSRKKYQRGCQTSIGFIPCRICGVKDIPSGAFERIAREMADHIDKGIIEGLK